MRMLLLLFIRLYQVLWSPYKGFRCAYRARTGRQSCSTFGFAAIDRHGAIVGLLLLQRRFRKCANAADLNVARRRAPARQAGYCDLPIGDCDVGHGCHGTDLLDCAPCDDGGCTERMWKKWLRRRET